MSKRSKNRGPNTMSPPPPDTVSPPPPDTAAVEALKKMTMNPAAEFSLIDAQNIVVIVSKRARYESLEEAIAVGVSLERFKKHVEKLGLK